MSTTTFTMIAGAGALLAGFLGALTGLGGGVFSLAGAVIRPSALGRYRSGKILPGLRMPCGSNAALTRFISAISSADNSRPR